MGSTKCSLPATIFLSLRGYKASFVGVDALAAVTLRPGGELTAKELTRALDALPPAERPAIVRVVDSIPVTTWYRPLTGALREAGIPSPDDAGTTWSLDDRRHSYRALTASRHLATELGATPLVTMAAAVDNPSTP